MRDPEKMKLAGTSISDKLKDTARAQGADPNFLFKKFGIERLVVRLNESRHKGNYCFKGGMVMLLANPEMPRTTEDLDFTALSPFSKEALLGAYREIAAVVPAQEDGIEMRVDDARAEKDVLQRDDAVNPGFRMFLDGVMHTLRRPVPLRIKLDAAYGEAITPAPVMRKLSPTIRGWDPPEVPVYPWETVLAEKIHAVCKHGMENTRLRDYYDIVAISRSQVISGRTAVQAIAATFALRSSADLDPAAPGLTALFAALKQSEWQALMGKRGFVLKLNDFAAVVGEVQFFAKPLLEAAAAGDEFDALWRPQHGWGEYAAEAVPEAEDTVPLMGMG